MPSQIPPILIVQHIPAGFSKAFADRLNKICGFEVKEAASGDEVKRDRVLIAPGGRQMAFRVSGGRRTVEITDAPPMNRHKPSVDYLFRSVAEAGVRRVVAGILTGMGTDGAAQMKALRAMGARTVAQDEATCVVFGMPRAAIEQGAAEIIAPLDTFADKVLSLSVAPTKSGAPKKVA
jgi:two-component system chemotaxis response regulator CheB